MKYFCYFYVHINVELYVVLSQKNFFTEYEHGYVHITKHRSGIRRYYLLCGTLVEHSTSGASKGEARKVEQQYKQEAVRAVSE